MDADMQSFDLTTTNAPTQEPIQPFSESTRIEYEQFLESQKAHCRFDATKRAYFRAILANPKAFKPDRKDPDWKKVSQAVSFNG